MHLKSLHTIWLTLFTVLVLLVSSVVNSAPMMNIQMMSNGMMNHNSSLPMTKMENNNDCGMPDMMDMSMMQHAEVKEPNMDCDSSGMVHTCCTAACTIVFVPLPIPASQASPAIYRATMTPEVTSPVVHVSRDLYRPPIA